MIPLWDSMISLALGCTVFVLLMAGIFMPLETRQPVHDARRTARSLAVGVGLVFANFFAMDLVGSPLLARLAWIDAIEDLHRWVDGWPRVASIAAVFLGAELCAYAVHRVMHAVPALWRFHAMHHAPERIDWLDAWRQHPIDFVIHGVVVGLPAALLGADFGDFAGVILLRKTYTTFLHANLSWRLEWLEWLLVTPRFHRDHHHGETPGNYAGTFPVLDRVFGTRLPAARPAPGTSRSRR